MSLFFANAGQAEMLRSSQKDQSYVDQIQSYSSDAVIRLKGTHAWIQYKDVCELLTRLSYYGLTTLCNSQTLGEEYTGMVQIDSRYITLPHKMYQLIAIILECAGERFLFKLLKLVEKQFESSDELRPEVRKKLLRLCAIAREFVPFCQRLHKGLFFLNGGYYSIPKRLMGINYVLIRHWLKDYNSAYGFKFLGVITLVHLSLYTTYNLWLWWVNKANLLTTVSPILAVGSSGSHNSSLQCVLCLEDRKGTSMIACGHLFCWDCIMEWFDSKAECPLCREPVIPARTLLLQNYE